jgi:hypothetical protein
MWKLKMEELLVDREQWYIVDPGTFPKGMSKEEWERLDMKEMSMIQLCLGECLMRRYYKFKTWDMLGNLY